MERSETKRKEMEIDISERSSRETKGESKGRRWIATDFYNLEKIVGRSARDMGFSSSRGRVELEAVWVEK